MSLKRDLPRFLPAQVLLALAMFAAAYAGFLTERPAVIAIAAALGVLLLLGLVEETRRNRSARLKAEWLQCLEDDRAPNQVTPTPPSAARGL